MHPITTVVNTTNANDVVTITDLLATEEGILSTRPKATAPLIIPAYEMKMRSLNLIPDLYPNSSRNLIIPIVPMNLPRITIISSAMKSYHDHSNATYEKKVSPRYPNTNASTAYPITLKAIDVTCLDYGERLYHEYLAIKIEQARSEIIPEKWKSSATQYER